MKGRKATCHYYGSLLISTSNHPSEFSQRRHELVHLLNLQFT